MEVQKYTSAFVWIVDKKNRWFLAICLVEFCCDCVGLEVVLEANHCGVKYGSGYIHVVE